jgi:hypothetical protein
MSLRSTQYRELYYNNLEKSTWGLNEEAYRRPLRAYLLFLLPSLARLVAINVILIGQIVSFSI